VPYYFYYVVMLQKNINTLRWIARITGGILLLLILTFMIGEGFPNPINLTVDEQKAMAALFMMEVGIIVAFKWELPGSILAIAGYLFFAFIEKNIIIGPVFPFFFIVGALFLFCWWLDKRQVVKS